MACRSTKSESPSLRARLAKDGWRLRVGGRVLCERVQLLWLILILLLVACNKSR